MLPHLKKNKTINSILDKFKKREQSSSESFTESETDSERRKRELCEEVGNNAKLKNYNYVCQMFKKYKEQLTDFSYIDVDNFKKLKLGGTLRYINIRGEIRYGGLLTGIENDETYETLKFIIRKQSGKFMKISFERNYIFFRPRRTKRFYLNKKLLEISENL